MTVRVAISPIRRSDRVSKTGAEREAVAEAVGRLFPDRELTMDHHPDGAPFIAGAPEIFVSVSHSLTHAAVAIADGPVGIDIEQPRPQLEKVAPRFLSDRERTVADTVSDGLLRAWTAKEAVFKTMREQAVDFARDIALSDDFATARFRDRVSLYLNVFDDFPEGNLLTVASLERDPEITIL
ncbi:MAG: 4'-phosphopantetheinyl transferase superfamily protein [Muribaculaceae bacterium]|nr:4'-phosphopantetheinyl transferase superfamily protein [Muribaculaceae bacterium]